MWAIKKCTFGLMQTHVFKLGCGFFFPFFFLLLLFMNVKENIQVNSIWITGVVSSQNM